MSSFHEIFETETSEQRKKRLHKESQAHYRKRQRTKYRAEEKDCNSNQTSPTFAICCAGSKISLPPLLEPPSYLLNLYTSSTYVRGWRIGDNQKIVFLSVLIINE
ncbi:hypothetical protein RhiirA4_482012 [Rhizophagus irregularis]|uniref:Uncharacterized protein n=1 Tax=Rhizophagus irregularis TaxID=588596 RepID=A0A2I1HKF7_9GLOM|nr:hypothetical protein RhiirA4_482012 [Rhizophagus irregularis]